MEPLSPTTLRQLPRRELQALYPRIAGELAALPGHDPRRPVALDNLTRIRLALVAIATPRPG